MNKNTQPDTGHRETEDLMSPRQIRWQRELYEDARVLAKDLNMKTVDVLRQSAARGFPVFSRLMRSSK